MPEYHITNVRPDGSNGSTWTIPSDKQSYGGRDRREVLEKAIADHIIIKPGQYVVFMLCTGLGGRAYGAASVFEVEEVSTPYLRIKT